MSRKTWWLTVLTRKTIPYYLKSLDNITIRFATTHFGFQEVDEKDKSKKGMTFHILDLVNLLVTFHFFFQRKVNF